MLYTYAYKLGLFIHLITAARTFRRQCHNGRIQLAITTSVYSKQPRIRIKIVVKGITEALSNLVLKHDMFVRYK